MRPFGSATDRTNLPVVTYPAAEVASTVRDAYAAAAQADGSEPTTDASRFLEPDFDLSPLDELRSTFAARLTEAHASIEARDQSSDRALVEVVATRRGANSAVARAYAMQQPAPVASRREHPALDFHQIATLLGDHPDLLRRLGLVVDLRLPAPELGNPIERVRVSPASKLPDGVGHRLPGTAATLDLGAKKFVPTLRDPGHDPRVLPVNQPEFHLESLDVDGAVRKSVALASSPTGPATAAPSAPPTLRNDGISLVHAGRAGNLHGRLASSRERRASIGSTRAGDPQETTLHAEDLILRVLRVDVFDDVTGSLPLAARAADPLHGRRSRRDPRGRRPVRRRGLLPGDPDRRHRTLHP